MAFRLPILAVGGGLDEDFKHDFDEPYSYCGVAPTGTAESSPVWTITRIEVLLDGTTIVKSAVGAWDDKENLIYN
jgi:hypothetical protein